MAKKHKSRVVRILRYNDRTRPGKLFYAGASPGMLFGVELGGDPFQEAVEQPGPPGTGA